MNMEYLSYLIGIEDGQKKAITEYKNQLKEKISRLRQDYPDDMEVINRIERLLMDEE